MGRPFSFVGAEVAHESASKMSKQKRPKSQPGSRIESVSIRPAANGGFIASCHYVPTSREPGAMMAYDSKEYALSSMDELHDFVVQEFGGEGEKS